MRINNMKNIINKSDLNYAADLINRGEVVAVPTETVYGLSASAYDAHACEKIFKLKGRPNYNPLIVHCHSIEQAREICEFDNLSLFIASRLCPGPISFVLPLKPNTKIVKNVTANLKTLCIRIPSNPIIQKLIQLVGKPLAIPSANISSMVSSTSYKHVYKDFKNKITIIAEDKDVFGIESTIIQSISNNNENKLHILRPGFIANEELIAILKNTDYENKVKIECETNSKIISPGMMKKHYCTRTPLMINCTKDDNQHIDGERLVLNFGNSNLKGTMSLNLSKEENLLEVAQNLYFMMRQLDEYAIQSPTIKYIAVAKIPNVSIGIAINNRLQRAATTILHIQGKSF